MEWIRLTFRLTGFGLFLAATSMLATLLLAAETLFRRPIDRTPWARRCFRGACWCLGLHVHVHGIHPVQNMLVVSNHISWSDIPILGSISPVLFLSKAEVGHWPVIGWLAREAGTLFIKRGGGGARRIRRAIAEKLDGGESILVFPEATTGRGLTVLPFHGMLLGAASDSGVPIQPVTISYRRNGRPDHLAPFVGEDTFHGHIVTMLRQPPARVDVLFHCPVEVDPDMGTAVLAEQLQSTVRAGLTRIQQGELDDPDNPDVRTAGGPGLSRPR